MCTGQLMQQMARRQAPGTVPALPGIGYALAGSQYVPGTIPLTPVRGGPSPTNPTGAARGNGPIDTVEQQKSRQGTLLGGGRKSLMAPTRRRTLLGGGDYGGGR